MAPDAEDEDKKENGEESYYGLDEKNEGLVGRRHDR